MKLFALLIIAAFIGAGIAHNGAAALDTITLILAGIVLAAFVACAAFGGYVNAGKRLTLASYSYFCRVEHRHEQEARNVAVAWSRAAAPVIRAAAKEQRQLQRVRESASLIELDRIAALSPAEIASENALELEDRRRWA